MARSIVESGDVTKMDTVLEIGPGTGVLTDILILKAKKVIAVEKDNRLIDDLNKKYVESITSRKLTIVHGDVLDMKLKDLGLRNQEFKVIANIPYYITGILLKRLLTDTIKPRDMVLLVQKEVAERIARDKKESILSLSVKAYGTPKYVRTVSSSYFKPQPKVDSAILSIKDISKIFFSDISEDDFFKIVKAGFRSKRKFLINNLEICGEKEILTNIFKRIGIDTKARAETLPLEKWKKLTQELTRETNQA